MAVVFQENMQVSKYITQIYMFFYLIFYFDHLCNWIWEILKF